MESSDEDKEGRVPPPETGRRAGGSSARSRTRRPDGSRPPTGPTTDRARAMSRARGRRARSTGRAAEEVVARWLQRSGWTILARNWRGTRGELDIVVASGSTIVFVEVKARRHLGYGSPAASLGPAQSNRLRKTALEFLGSYREAQGRAARFESIRFDVVAVFWADDRTPVIERFPGAF